MSGSSSKYSTQGKNSAELALPVHLIRAVAIIIVIVIHASDVYSYSLQVPRDVLSWWVTNVFKSVGYLGVPLFVILSGTLLLNPSKTDEPLRVFFQKRLTRIALPFLFWGAAYFAYRRFTNHEIVTFDSIWRGFLGSYPYPYSHFWFLFMLIGLYLVTPILRVVVAHASSKILRYFILLWFLGTAIMPILGRFALFYLGSGILIVSGWVGYFMLGAYLRTIHVRSRIVYALVLVSGVLWTAVGTCFLTFASGYLDQFFYDYLSANVILASVGLFMFLYRAPVNGFESRFPWANRLLRQVGLCSFAIYLFHSMVLGILGEKGLFGFNLGIIMLNPILGIPLLSLVTLIVSFGAVWLLRKVPMLNKAIG